MTKYLDNEGLTHFTGKMKEYADGKAGEVDSKVTTHVGNKQNPHGVTKAQVGLGSVDNVQQIPLSQRGTVNGVATLDAKGKIPVTQMPTTKTINGASIFGTGDLQLSASLYKIVDKLPTTDIDTSKIYLVPAESFTTNNYKTEYIYLGDPNKAYDESKWEKIGDEKTNNITPTPGGSITVDTAFNATSSNPIANKTVTKKFGVVDDALKAKVAQETYDDKMATIDSKLKTLENKTIDVDAELKDSPNPVQNRAVNKAVNDLNTEIGKKANDADLTTAKGRIDTLESNSISINDITLIPVTDGNGIASIEKQNKKLVITQGKFVTSLIGYVTSGTLNTTLAGYAKSETLASYYTKKEIDGKGYLTEHQSLAGYVNEVQPDKTSGNGIANITKEGKILKVTKSTFLTEHQSLADYATKTWVGEQDFVKGTIPTKVSDLTNDSGFLTQQSLKGYWNQLYVDERDGNGIADIWVDINNKSELCVSKRRFITPETLGDAIDDYASDKGYLTENNLNEKLKETVTIKLVSDKSASDTNLNGATITVKSGNTTVSTQTWQGTPIKVEVPCDKDVTIEAATVKMYVKPKVLKYIPSPLYNREVAITYKALETGTFLVDKNDNLYTSPTTFTEAGLSITDAVGVLLVTNNVAIVIAPRIIYNTIWSSKSNLIEGCATFPEYLNALKDFAGAANTAAIIRADNNSYIAARCCSDYVFKNGKKGYLMSAGEAKEIAENFYSIGPKLNAINSMDAPSESGKYWTSTQMNAYSAWGFSMNRTSPSEVSKPVQTNAFAIYSLYD